MKTRKSIMFHLSSPIYHVSYLSRILLRILLMLYIFQILNRNVFSFYASFLTL